MSLSPHAALPEYLSAKPLTFRQVSRRIRTLGVQYERPGKTSEGGRSFRGPNPDYCFLTFKVSHYPNSYYIDNLFSTSVFS